MTGSSQTEEPGEQEVLQASPGDVLISNEALPYPGSILVGFRKQQVAPEFDPYVEFREIRELLEFLEHVVLCERLVVPITRYTAESERIINGKKSWVDFAVFTRRGDLDYTTERLVKRLEAAGVITSAAIGLGEASADDVVASLLPHSPWMGERFTYYSGVGSTDERLDKFAVAHAHMAARIGAPLHVAQAAGLVRVPFILGSREAMELTGYEREISSVRRSVTKVLLDRLNEGARRELERLSDLGPAHVFPETPIASLIVNEASTVDGLVDVALQLRKEFAKFRRVMNQLESEFAGESQPIARRLKRRRELDALATSLWKGKETNLSTTAVAISEALLAIPDATSAPSPKSIGTLATKLLALPFQGLLAIYRKRKIRLLLRAKRGFLRSHDATGKLARILGVSKELARKSQALDKAPLTKRFALANPRYAARYYGT